MNWMDELLKQLQFARQSTIDYVKQLEERRLEIMPKGFNNHIKWNLGHLYVAFENIVFRLIGENAKFPINFPELFSPGTSPKQWTMEAPETTELITLLEGQLERLASLQAKSLDEAIPEVYTTSTGAKFLTVGDCVSFIIYHEGMHFGIIKSMNQVLQEGESN